MPAAPPDHAAKPEIDRLAHATATVPPASAVVPTLDEGLPVCGRRGHGALRHLGLGVRLVRVG